MGTLKDLYDITEDLIDKVYHLILKVKEKIDIRTKQKMKKEIENSIETLISKKSIIKEHFEEGFYKIVVYNILCFEIYNKFFRQFKHIEDFIGEDGNLKGDFQITDEKNYKEKLNENISTYLKLLEGVIEDPEKDV